MPTTSLRAVAPVAGLVAAAAAGLIAAAGPAGAQADPPGNNGTVKIDGVEFDLHPDNQPHVGCTFQVDFYGFDEGDLFADVTFEAIEPTGAVEPLLTDEVFIGEDDNSGGGSEEGLDAERTYDLTEALAGVTPHPQQGWHVKLTVHAEGSQGADPKFKVFWVSGCEPTTSTSTPGSTTSSSTTSTVPGSTTTTEIKPGSSTTVVPGPGEPGTPPSEPGAPGGPPSQPVDAAPAASSGGLPLTGANSVPLAAAAVGLVGLGAAGIFASRYVRTAGER